MAKEEEDTYPAYIDYEGTDVTNPVEGWSTTQFEEYWWKLITKIHRAAAYPFNIKNRSQLKRLVTQYGEELKEMMDDWVHTHSVPEAINFGLFYVNREKVYAAIKPKDYTWD